MTKARVSTSLQKIEEARSQLAQALLPSECESSYTVGRLLGSGDDHTVILAWKKPDGASGDSPQHLLPRVMKFIRRGSATVMSEGLAEELHNRCMEVSVWLLQSLGGPGVTFHPPADNSCRRLSVHPHMLKLGDVFPTPDYLVVGMEYANAKSLERSLSMQYQSRGTCALPYPLAVFFFQQLVLTMEFCHQNGVHFRGLQPKYVLISRDKQGNPLVKLGAGGFRNVNDEVAHADLEDPEVEAAWRKHALYAPPEDLDRWLHQLRNPPAKGTAQNAIISKRMMRHHSHNSTISLDKITSSKRQQSMPVPACKRVVYIPDQGLRWQDAHASYGAHARASKRGSSAGITKHTVGGTRATRCEERHAQRSPPHSCSTSPSNPARVAASARAFGSAITLPSPDGERSTAHATHSRRSTPPAAGAHVQAEIESASSGDHTVNNKHSMNLPVNSHVSSHPRRPSSSSDGPPAQPDVFVFQRPSPFLPPMREPTSAPLHVPHASRAHNKYPTFLRAPASEGSAGRGPGVQFVPSFKEWGVTDRQGLEVVEGCAASVWAAGCMLFEMLYGYHPFQMEAGETVDEWVAKVRSFDVRWPEAVPHTDECRRALSTMLAPHHRRASLAAIRNLAFFRRELPEGAFDMTTHANARVAALRPHLVQDVLSRLCTLVDTCAAPRAPSVSSSHYSTLPGSLGGPMGGSCAAQSAQGSGMLCASPASSA